MVDNTSITPSATPLREGTKEALQDYQMQLMLLDHERKKEREMMARQEQYGKKSSSAMFISLSEGAGKMQATDLYRTSQQNLSQRQPVGMQKDLSQDSFEFDTTDSTLQMAMSILSRALGLEGESALTLDQLQYLVSETRAKEIPPKYQMIHRVSHFRDTRMYLDKPQWMAGEHSDKDALAGNLPIHNVPEYLSKHPEICFVI